MGSPLGTYDSLDCSGSDSAPLTFKKGAPSGASIYEISLKVRHGKLPEAVEFESDLILNIEDVLGYTLLPIEPESLLRAARFEDKHADPPLIFLTA
jgi:PIN domain nuclease of toxin-antitoxin system